MSHHHHHKHSKHEKKLAVLARNRRMQMMFDAMRGREHEVDRVESLRESKAPKGRETPGEEVIAWSAKTQEIRNKLTGSKRMAQERWNRFSGTSDAGARGR